MGKRMRFRETEQDRIRRYADQVLAARAQRRAPRPIERYAEFDQTYKDRIESLRQCALRRPEEWECRIKSRAPTRRFLDLVDFTFARYRAPGHLIGAWTAPAGSDIFCYWYVVVTQGGQFYKKATNPYLSKMETHHFLTAPNQIATSRSAYWYAIARMQSDRQHVAVAVAESKLGKMPLQEAGSFWPEVARFFARNPATSHEIDDLVDYIEHEHQQQESFSLKGRTLPTLRRRAEEWHRALAKSRSIGGGSWAGMPIQDSDYEAGSKDKRAIWRFRQITTGDALHKEGQRMRHCMAAYKGRCMKGEIAIWSLTYEFPIGIAHRGITMEITKAGTIVQARGYANRQPLANEATMIEKWARDNGLLWTRR